MTVQTFSFHHFNPASGATWKMQVDGETIVAIDVVPLGKPPVSHTEPGLLVLIGTTPFTIGEGWRRRQHDIPETDNFVWLQLVLMDISIPRPMPHPA